MGSRVVATDAKIRARIRVTRRGSWRFALSAVGLALAGFELRGRLPGPAAVGTALAQSRPGWTLAAAALSALSMAAFAEQQRQLLAELGVRISAPASLAVTYARSAMATALPGGSVVSAGYAFRQFTARGATQPVAAAVMLLSGAASVAGLLLLYGGDIVAWTSPSPGGALLIFAAATLVGFGLVQLLRIRAARALGLSAIPAGAAESRWRRRMLTLLGETIAQAGAVRPQRWLAVITLAAVNWLTDLACLLAALHAIGLNVPLRTVASAFLAAQLLRQIPLTPSGIGLIEASLIIALTPASGGQSLPAAAVLIYRMLSCWSLLPIGLACWLRQKTEAQPASQPVAAAPPSRPLLSVR